MESTRSTRARLLEVGDELAAVHADARQPGGVASAVMPNALIVRARK